MNKPQEFKRYIPSIEDINQIYKKYTRKDIFQKTRLREVVDYRKMFVCLATKYTKTTLHEIARYFEMNHATMIHYRRTFDVVVASNPLAFEAYLSAEKDVVDTFPYAAEIFLRNLKKPDVKSAHLTYLRKMHAFSIKIEFYRKLTYMQQKKIDELLNAEKNEEQLHQS